LPGRPNQLLGENAGGEKSARGSSRANAQKIPSRPKQVVVIHGFGASWLRIVDMIPISAPCDFTGSEARDKNNAYVL
jgi:hypothetical protein